MAFLAGLNDYLLKNYRHSTFEQAAGSEALYTLHLHGRAIFQGRITASSTYDVVVTASDNTRRELPKIQIKMLHPSEYTDQILSQITIDEAVQPAEPGPIVPVKQRNFIKNKSLYPLMRGQEALTVTLLEGEVVQGTIHSFSRYEITLTLPEQQQVVVMRHALLDVRDTQGCCFLKSCQQSQRDWTRSDLYIDPRPRSELRPGLKKVQIKRRRKIIIR